MTRIIILAAGKGARMGSDLPKVLMPLHGQPMIKYLMEAVVASQIDARPLIVVSPDNKEIISESLKEYNLEYVVQDQQLGTGHAVSCAVSYLTGTEQSILVLYGDHPFLKSESLKKFAAANPAAVTIMPTRLSDFDDWRQNFYHLGRIVRGANGTIEGIVEFKDASEEEKLITEINLGFMCFNKQWLLKNISKLKDDNKQQEYYLTDLVKIAFAEGFAVDSIHIEAHEALGINSQQDLLVAESLV
jgi:bifunctional UDP-N-acetylglucosamine pyrophosphorylase/glucosamine-1-phosphate N-acetyltransferase